MNQLEQKSQKIQKWTKIIAFGGLCLLLGPVYILMLQGIAALAALGIAAAVAVVAINLMPAFSVMVANWRLKSLKAAAAANPIETLENRYQERMAALAGIRENITKSFAVLQSLYSQIQEHNKKFPERPSQHAEKYVKLKSLVELRGAKYKQAQSNLHQFSGLIEEKRSDWEIAKTMAEASQLASVGEDFQSKLLHDTALVTIQDGLNMAFAELETSLLDEQQPGTLIATNKETSRIPEKCGPPSLDLDFDVEEIEFATVKTKK